MNNMAITESNLHEIGTVKRGKVRDVYDMGKNLLIVSTDRISAFDVVLPNGIPDKGFVLNQLSRYWFEKTSDIVPNHLITTDIDGFPAACQPHREILEGRR